jgi:hypothetical protein
VLRAPPRDPEQTSELGPTQARSDLVWLREGVLRTWWGVSGRSVKKPVATAFAGYRKRFADVAHA